MKKLIIASLVGAVIIFVYSALSWMIMPTHKNTFKYLPSQDVVLSNLSQNITEDGTYLVPHVDQNDPEFATKQAELGQANVGKPSAIIFFTKAANDMNPSMFIYGFIYDFLTVMFLCIILAAGGDKLNSFFYRWWLCVLVGGIVVLQSSMKDHTWQYFPWHYVSGAVIDVLIGFGMCGAWLAWYFGRK